MTIEMQLLLQSGTFLYIHFSLLIITPYVAYYLKFSCRQKSNEAAAATTSTPSTPRKQGTQPSLATSSPVTRLMAAAIAKACSPPSALTRSKTNVDSPLKQV